MLPIAPGDSSRLDVHFITNGFSGDGEVELLVWDVSDSAGSVQTLSFTVKNDPSFATSVSDILTEEDVDLSVVNGYVQLSATSGARLTVNIYDLLGNQVKSDHAMECSHLMFAIYPLRCISYKFYMDLRL